MTSLLSLWKHTSPAAHWLSRSHSPVHAARFVQLAQLLPLSGMAPLGGGSDGGSEGGGDGGGGDGGYGGLI